MESRGSREKEEDSNTFDIDVRSADVIVRAFLSRRHSRSAPSGMPINAPHLLMDLIVNERHSGAPPHTADTVTSYLDPAPMRVRHAETRQPVVALKPVKHHKE
ncbi:hypothetical protein FIBSPDRAFT_945748 [Athelia psychrophila]|uniref:Uncharacterized protein n=1 Tax=Athelia psychrophila TaxID=1759441 RepID=A0A166TP59_9AGAM|nr:hypothetical protein FIBSPDRAFT_945748 [Fibularhizoctonia sp. CBS 109695]